MAKILQNVKGRGERYIPVVDVPTTTNAGVETHFHLHPAVTETNPSVQKEGIRI
jgi:hypothetical protein